MIKHRKIVMLLTSILLVLGLVGCGATGQEVKDESQEQGNVVAVVNDENISQQEFDESLDQLKMTYAQQGMNVEDLQEDQLKEMEQQVVNQLVNTKLLLQAAEKNDIEATEEEVEQSLVQIKDQFENDEDFKSALEANNLTLDQLEKQIAEELKINQYITENTVEVTVEEEEIMAMYDQYKEQSEEVPAYEEVKAQLEQQIKQQKSQEEFGKLVQKLRDDSEIEVLI
ncbi:SurA N-terminal domain-containing protein [Bacillus luteolus]|uniref:SurA N-terminal domain-containing protein n=1 Tax=Litchfieldia luteola TaxID=682179 RepID=A0ABR9QEC4_9BACI|nr:SurA N-terminal domain-containing protein [Cytobacillus luteolus]MBE4906851.1 SurA N-terminal domain-containing protein [Cytobacillus luteolus]MBP1940494.1 FKBP-type peptidyl-prolyl cis-trans isomerase (trigger factor) [Cytobacillus luteolus]